jgi:hypothetical protein
VNVAVPVNPRGGVYVAVVPDSATDPRPAAGWATASVTAPGVAVVMHPGV